ncbi:MAG: hypothetical protein JSS81_05400 [Acidobacteria bacterium]|nr:hypothetical protein [Acidobacteriota bacterium]
MRKIIVIGILTAFLTSGFSTLEIYAFEKTEKNVPVFRAGNAARPIKRRKAGRFAGRWKGMVYQPGNASWQKYYFRMTLFQKGKTVTGFSRIAIAESPEYFGVMRLRGTAGGNRLSFRETKVVREKMAENSFWCVKSGTLRLVYRNGRPELRGNWRGQEGCAPGTIVLRKVSGRRK